MAYSEQVLDHYNNPRNVGTMSQADASVGTGMVGAPACGDVMKLQIKVTDDVITDACFKTYGCGSAIASSSLLTTWVKGKTLTEAEETAEAKAIIQLFRFHMAPELKNDSSPHRYMTLPSTFDIHYMYTSGVGDNATSKENTFYNKIATGVLTSVNVDYTPNAEVESFGDGAPTQISLALSFKETEMMTKQKINDGF